MATTSEDGISSIVMEAENTADYFFPVLVEHWNDSVNSIIQMGIELSNANSKCSKDEFATLSKRLEGTGIASKKQQENLMAIPKSTMVLNYYKKCASEGNKPSLPNDWKVLHQVSLLSQADFDSGIRNDIIGATTTIGDINKLRAGTHLRLPNPKTVKSDKEKLEGKIVARLAIDFDKIETKKQAQEIDNAIETAFNKLSGSYEFAANSTVSVGEMFAGEEQKIRDKKRRIKERMEKKLKGVITTMNEIDPSIITTIDPALTSGLAKFAPKQSS